MIIDIILITIGLIALIFGTVTDFKTREVPDWITYSLIFMGIGLRLIYSLTTNDWMFLLWGVIGIASFTAVSFAMFYTGQWGGGDAKLLIGLGAMFGSYPVYLLNYFSPNLTGSFLLAILLNIFFAGAFWGMLCTLYLIMKNKDKFSKAFMNYMKRKDITLRRRVLLYSSIAIILASFFIPDTLVKFSITVIVIITFLTFHLWIIVKSIEDVAMYKKLLVSKLTEGDWIVEDVKAKGKLIYKKKKIGVETDDIIKLKKHNIKEVLVREGIPFVPSFLAGFIISILYGNVLFTMLGLV